MSETVVNLMAIAGLLIVSPLAAEHGSWRSWDNGHDGPRLWAVTVRSGSVVVAAFGVPEV